MRAKRILAGLFAVIILLKLIFLAINPHLWTGAVKVLQGQQTMIMLVYLLLLVITGYYAFSSLDLINIAVVMLFTSLLMALTMTPYISALPKLPEEIISMGVGKAWLPILIWVALAAAVLYKIFSPGRR
jgi:Na+-transporting methylmalonyl-CoA/oxaloacetate decarboxylase beta subunit